MYYKARIFNGKHWGEWKDINALLMNHAAERAVEVSEHEDTEFQVGTGQATVHVEVKNKGTGVEKIFVVSGRQALIYTAVSANQRVGREGEDEKHMDKT